MMRLRCVGLAGSMDWDGRETGAGRCEGVDVNCVGRGMGIDA